MKSNCRLTLYVNGSSPATAAALTNLRALCAYALPGQYEVVVIDVVEEPAQADAANVVHTPTLLKTFPLPARRIVGDLSDREAVLRGLDIPRTLVRERHRSQQGVIQSPKAISLLHISADAGSSEKLQHTLGSRARITHVSHDADPLAEAERNDALVALLSWTPGETERAAEVLRDIRRDLPVVVLLEQSDAALSSTAIELGAHDVVVMDEWHGLDLLHAIYKALAQHDSRDLYRALIDASPDGMLVLDAEGTVRYSNFAARCLMSQLRPMRTGETTTSPLQAMGSSGRISVASGLAIEARHSIIEWDGRACDLAVLRSVDPQPFTRDVSSVGKTQLRAASLSARFDRVLDSLWMAYQPIVDCPTDTIFAYEALVRSEETTLSTASEILEAAEHLERLHELGRRIRSRVASLVASTPGSALFFVNVHAQDLDDPDLFAADAPLSGVSSRVVLEITERASLSLVDDILSKMRRLRALGFKIAVDDLGAGYSGLSSFSQLEPDFAKLDMSLVRGVESSRRKQSVIRAMSKLCVGELAIQLVCEGVETAPERDALLDSGCALLQGFLFAKPDKSLLPSGV